MVRVMSQKVSGMAETLDGKHAIMADPRNSHFGWVFKRNGAGKWVSLRKATEEEMRFAYQAADIHGKPEPVEFKSIAQRLREYVNNPHHVDPMSDAFRLLIGEAVHALSGTDFDAQRLRADTAEADALIQYEKRAVAVEELAAAEQRIADLSQLLFYASERLSKVRYVGLHKRIRAALNQKSEGESQ